MSKKQNKITFVINNVPDDTFEDFHWELSELTRKFPTVNFRFKQNGKVSCPIQGMPVAMEKGEFSL